MIQNKKFTIKGMDCGGCGAAIERMLNRQDGIKSVKINLDNGETVIEFDDSKIEFKDIDRIISQMGYTIINK